MSRPSSNHLSITTKLLKTQVQQSKITQQLVRNWARSQRSTQKVLLQPRVQGKSLLCDPTEVRGAEFYQTQAIHQRKPKPRNIL